jgi:hypothetical protein
MVIEGLLIRTCMGFEQIARLRTSFAAIRFNKITVKNMMQHVSFRTGISTSDEESFRYLGQGVEGDAERTLIEQKGGLISGSAPLPPRASSQRRSQLPKITLDGYAASQRVVIEEQ